MSSDYDINATKELNEYMFNEMRLSTYERNIIKEFEDFYYQKENYDILLGILNNSDISIRLIDHFVTRFSKDNKTSYEIESNGKVNLFNIYKSYRDKLRKWNKKYFDPFSRGDRIPFFFNSDKCIITTIGQLNFFHWFITYNIHNFVLKHLKEIDVDMNMKNSKGKKSKKITNKITTKKSPPVIINKKSTNKYGKNKVSFSF